MRSTLVTLALLAWILSCFDAVSYIRARENEIVAQAAGEQANAALISKEVAATRNDPATRERIDKDETAVQSDQAALQHATAARRNTAREQQALTADTAKLQADRIVQYNAQDDARRAADPQIAAAREDVDLYRNSAAKWHAIRVRDRSFTQGLLALWGGVLVLGLLSARRRSVIPPMIANGHSH